MEKKRLALVLLLILFGVIIVLLFKRKEILNIVPLERRPPTTEIYELRYRIMILNYTIEGETRCIGGNRMIDLLRYNLQVDLSKSLRKKVRLTFDTINNKLICFDDFCGNWEIKLNNKTVLLNDSCGGGTLELRFLG